VKRPTFIARQSSRPRGLLGRIIAWIMVRETAALNDRALALLDVQPTDHVLEVGFGPGRSVERIAAAAERGHVAGIDASVSMMRLAARRNRAAVTQGRVELIAGDCVSLPFDDARFDKAISVHTLYFWSDPHACLREILRVLRPDARLVLAFTPKDSPLASSFPAAIYTFHDVDVVRSMLMDAGFDSVELSRSGDAVIAVAGKPERAASRVTNRSRPPSPRVP
jgi:ubiquinone/menaquinone biosynthesis C-methylase UbiE